MPIRVPPQNQSFLKLLKPSIPEAESSNNLKASRK